MDFEQWWKDGGYLYKERLTALEVKNDYNKVWDKARLHGIAEAKENYDHGLESITSFYQSKRAQLKKQLTHWYGKFTILKAENNKLRAKVKTMEAAIAVYNLIMKSKSGNVVVVGKDIDTIARQKVTHFLEEKPSVQKQYEFLNKEPIKC